MRWTMRITRSRWVRSFLGVAVLAVLVWFFGPLLGFGDTHPLVTETVRIIAIVVLFVLWLIVNLIQELNARRRDKALVEEVAAPDPDATASAEETALLGERLRDALHTLKRAKLGDGERWGRRRPLYQLPWYMVIGPPGAGKTTALVNSGLKFPLADTQGGAHALRGVGGTRNCDWWFTDQAVLIDTAGRYTTQDSHAAVDSAAWLGFLRLLKKHRRRQPLNGVLVAISLSDLAALAEDERLAHARAIRRRVRELHDELGVRLPVYVLFTKADLLAGFVEFFDSMGKEEREQVWGTTFPLDDGKDEGGTVARFGAEFDGLLARLNDRMLERIHQEPDVQRRRLIYGFPQQVASLRDTAAEFLGEIFRPSRLEARPLLRGAYFTSGTQDGTPIDRLLGAMAGQFGLPRQVVAAHSGGGRSYFLGRLIRDVVFGEASLVSLDPRVEARARWAARAAWAACALVLLILTGSWIGSYVGNKALIAQVHAETARYTAQYDDLAKRGPDDTDLAAPLPALATLREIPGGYDKRSLATPVALTFGLYQGHKLTAASVDAYYRALNGVLLPRLLSRLEGQMAANLDKPDFLYQALKVYLILGREGPLDRGLVEQWMQADVANAYPGDEDAPTRDALLAHVKAMIARPLTAIPLNGPLVEQVRTILNKEPLAEYSYNRIMRSPRVRALPAWTVAENGEPGASRVFTLRSGQPLGADAGGVPGIYTWAGYHSVFLPLLPTVTQDIAEDGWVLGQDKRGGITNTVAKVNQLRRDVLGLYLDDYTRRWDAMLADIAVKPFTSVQAGLDELNLLSAPASPLRNLLQSVDAQTQLSRAAATDQAAAQAEAKAAKIGQKAAGFAAFEARAGLDYQSTALLSILGEAVGPGPSGKPVDPATRVDEHFRALHDFVTGHDKEPAPLEAAIGKIQALYQNFNQVANAPSQGQALLGAVAAGGGGAGGGGGGAAAQLQALAKDLPKPVAAMLQTVSQSSAGVAASGATQELTDAWKSKVLPLCQAAFNRYPFVAGSAVDVPPDDFAHLLGPGGLVDQFFDQNLKPFVNTDSTPWRWQAGDGVKLALSPGSLAEFERAALIRDGLFANGPQVSVHFQLVPVSLDPGIAQVTLDIAGQTMTYGHGPAESQSFIWPGPGGKTLVRLTMTPADASTASDVGAGGGANGAGLVQGGQVVEKDGPWALLRLLDAARVVPSGRPDKFRVVFTGAGGSATFDLLASSVRNPFTMSALRSFRCPAHL